MKRILFVDDEPRILEGLRNLLRKHRRKWDMVFAVGGEAALELLSAQTFDVIVSDMRMPGVDGAQLLTHAKRHHPKMVRIILSGYMDMKIALQAVPVAHQYLSKPCDAQELENVVERACGVQSLLDDEQLRQIIGGIDHLPSAPRIYHALMQAFAEDRADADQIAELLRQDIAICAKLLQVVNSAFFRLARRITNVQEAVYYLGFNMVRNLALTIEIFETAPPVPRFSMDTLQDHALRTAALARKMLDDKRLADDAFMAGLLHDIGHLIMVSALPDQFDQALALMEQEKIPLYAAEQRLLGVSHAEMGAYLLGLWGLPYPIIEATAYHHQPQRVPQHSFDVLAAVYLANLLMQEITGDNPYELLDMGYVEGLGVTPTQLAQWRNEAAHTLVTES